MHHWHSPNKGRNRAQGRCVQSVVWPTGLSHEDVSSFKHECTVCVWVCSRATCWCVYVSIWEFTTLTDEELHFHNDYHTEVKMLRWNKLMSSMWKQSFLNWEQFLKTASYYIIDYSWTWPTNNTACVRWWSVYIEEWKRFAFESQGS